MCKAPNTLADGTQVACRECSLCQERAKLDWVGRNLAETKTAKYSYVLTLTYGRGRVGEVLHERAVILTYSDCQKFMKLLRRHGWRVRHFITGEYGGERGRAHWNVILYSDEPIPQLAGWDQYGRWTAKAYYTQRFNWVRTNAQGEPVYLQNGQPAYWWPHGFIAVDVVNMRNVRYVCKYVLKDLDSNGKQGHKGQALNPPIGAKYFQQLAEKYVAQGLAPQTPEYRFPEAKRRNGEVIPFWLKARSLELFLEHFIHTWAEQRPDQPRPPSQLVDLFEEWGRVVWNEDAATELMVADITSETKLDMVLRGEVDPYAMKRQKDPWEPLLESNGYWDNFYRSFADGEERRQAEEQFDVERWQDWITVHDRCIKNGAEPRYADFYCEVKTALQNHYDACARSASERSGDSADVQHETWPAGETSPPLGKVGKWNANYPRETGANAFGSGGPSGSQVG